MSNNIINTGNTGIQNQAVIDIHAYYEMRKENESLRHRAIELEKGEILRLKETIKELKMSLIVVLTQGRGGLEMIPPYEVTTENTTLVIKLKPEMVMSTKFNDVQVKTK